MRCWSAASGEGVAERVRRRAGGAWGRAGSSAAAGAGKRAGKETPGASARRQRRARGGAKESARTGAAQLGTLQNRQVRGVRLLYI